MYLKGSKWSVARQRRRTHPVRVFFLAILVIGAIYVNQVVVPATPPLFIPTPTPTLSPQSFLNNAQELVAGGKISQAITMYEDAIKADPRNPIIYVTLARLQVLYGDYEKAMENVENALLINQNYALGHAVRGWILGKEQDFLSGEGEIKNALELDPNSALAYAYWAELYKDQMELGKGDFEMIDKASEVSKKAVDLDPNQLEVRRARGLVLEVTGNYEEAITEFEAAIQMNSNLAELYIALGRNYRALAAQDQDLGKYAQAIEMFRKGISLRPDVADPYYELGSTYLTVGEFSKGIQIAQQAVEREPANPLMWGLLGTLYYKSGEYNEAISALGRAVKGGLTDKGQQVEPIPADGGLIFVLYYARYGVALANLGQCNEALQISQQLAQQAVPEYAETANLNAQEIVDICRDVADSPAPPSTTPTPGP